MSKTTRRELTSQERDYIRIALDFYVEEHAKVRRPQAIRVKALLHSERDPLAIDESARKMARNALTHCADDIAGMDVDPADVIAKLEVENGSL